mmetsp:Transcript_27/g.66  ORF Transcript_27/g.66 Transcript_27/m.66 type:complete len:207 (+) Transcript_27:309-929(+)
MAAAAAAAAACFSVALPWCCSAASAAPGCEGPTQATTTRPQCLPRAPTTSRQRHTTSRRDPTRPAASLKACLWHPKGSRPGMGRRATTGRRRPQPRPATDIRAEATPSSHTRSTKRAILAALWRQVQARASSVASSPTVRRRPSSEEGAEEGAAVPSPQPPPTPTLALPQTRAEATVKRASSLRPTGAMSLTRSRREVVGGVATRS